MPISYYIRNQKDSIIKSINSLGTSQKIDIIQETDKYGGKIQLEKEFFN